jgi:hypothetical protein
MKRNNRKNLKRIARGTDGTVYQHIGTNKFNAEKKWQGRWKSGAGRSFGAASDVRHIKPATYEPLQRKIGYAGPPPSRAFIQEAESLALQKEADAILRRGRKEKQMSKRMLKKAGGGGVLGIGEYGR